VYIGLTHSVLIRNTTNTRGISGVKFKLYIVMVVNEEKINVGKKGKGHPCTGTEALYRPYGP
jgi:hypothetical protein